MSEREKIFVGEQFFHQDLYPNLTLDGAAVSETYGPFDWQELHGRVKVVAEIFGGIAGATTKEESIAVVIQGSSDKENWTTLVTANATPAATAAADGTFPIAEGKFAEYIASDPAILYGRVTVTVPAGIAGAALKVGLAYA